MWSEFTSVKQPSPLMCIAQRFSLTSASANGGEPHCRSAQPACLSQSFTVVAFIKGVLFLKNIIPIKFFLP
jgi:hypothetical protein